MSRVLVGLDSGGTRTNVEVVVDGQDRSASYEVSDSLSGSLEPAKYGSCLVKLLAPLDSHLERLGALGQPIYLFISAAGFTPWVRDDFVDAMHEMLPDFGHGAIQAAGAANDAVTLLLGLEADGVVIAGTGSNVLVKGGDGTIHQVGGHEWVACDYGSAFWIGLRAVRQAYRDLESGVDSVILQRLEQLYGLRPNDHKRLTARLRDLAIADASMKKEIARFAASVCSAAERGDAEAQNIVKAEAEDLADVTAGALRRFLAQGQIADGISLVQCGSVLANEFYRGAFESQIDMRLRTTDQRGSSLRWQRFTTGGEAAVRLAARLDGPVDELLNVDRLFRPAVVRF